MKRIMIVACSVMLGVLTVGCGSGSDGDVSAGGGTRNGSGEWSPPAPPAHITGPAASVTPAKPAGDCVPPAAGSGDEPVTSDDPQSCTAQASSRLGAVLIKAGKGQYPSALIAVRDDTEIRRRTDSGYEEQTFAALTPGSRLEVWFEGAVAESFPVQATAGTIVIDR